MAKEPEDEQPSGNENIRRVYALPAEMVERITKFQKDKGLASEVEAARRLIDEALKSRDNMQTIINRLLARLGQTKIAAEAARDVLVGHPLVVSVTFKADSVAFTLKDGGDATVYESGHVFAKPGDYSGEWVFDDNENKYAGGNFEVPF
ncbi:hypothetical protein G5B31_12775 [Rhodobacter sp. SGA-6-6]|uniref:hypothetical protein n=1 Tax=Rhodobacter sp. SGA-6-6 TaxID=2710882 RepID=UPI0013ED69D4|nr:hypothetical protein [Rhodobacter sp. SGA-6-6]NGM46409.1 hypothetical protein [Rhodobacter sp. SGA-6-6]